MHPDHAIRARRRGGELGQRDARRVARQPLARRERGVAPAQERELQLEVLGRRLDDEVARREVLRPGAGLDARDQALARVRGHLPLLDLLAEDGRDLPLALLGQVEGRVDEDDLQPRRGGDLRDAAAHLAGAEDADRPDLIDLFHRDSISGEDCAREG